MKIAFWLTQQRNKCKCQSKEAFSFDNVVLFFCSCRAKIKINNENKKNEKCEADKVFSLSILFSVCFHSGMKNMTTNEWTEYFASSRRK